MSDEVPVTVFLNTEPAEAIEQPAVEQPAELAIRQQPSPEEARAIEAVFAQQQESHLVAGLLGLWTSAQVMRDIAVDTFRSSDEDEEQDPPRRKKKEEPEDDPE